MSRATFEIVIGRLSVALLIVGCAVPAAGARGSSLSISKHVDPVPAEIAVPLQQLLAPGGARVSIGATILDFWWVKSLRLTEKGSGGAQVGWSQVAEGSLVGAVRFSAPHRDIRGRTVKPGVYTLRFGLQPANGDHLGVSPFREFLLISPASADSDVNPTGHDGTVELSKRTLGISHPAVWSLNPPTTDADVLGIRVPDEGHEAVVFEIPVERSGKAAGAIRFGLILVGKIEA